MKRRPPQTFDAFCREAVDFLTHAKAPYLIIGGLAVGAVGEPRMTGDVDVIGYLSMEQASALIDAAVVGGFEVASDERERLDATGTLRFRKGRFQLDIILASLPFEDETRTWWMRSVSHVDTSLHSTVATSTRRSTQSANWQRISGPVTVSMRYCARLRAVPTNGEAISNTAGQAGG